MNAQAWIAIALTIAVVLVMILLLRSRKRESEPQNTQTTLPPPPVQLSIVEQCCLQTLQQVAGGEHNIRTKVAPEALAVEGMNRIRKRLDFVLYSKKNGKPACVVQLKSPTDEDKQLLDQALSAAGIPLYRLPRKSSYAFIEISELLQPHLEKSAPSPDEMLATVSMQAFHSCSKCQSQMQLKRASSGPHKGMLFWVCAGYPSTCSNVELYNE